MMLLGIGLSGVLIRFAILVGVFGSHPPVGAILFLRLDLGVVGAMATAGFDGVLAGVLATDGSSLRDLEVLIGVLAGVMGRMILSDLEGVFSGVGIDVVVGGPVIMKDDDDGAGMPRREARSSSFLNLASF
jgi:hypothetical protein